MRNARRPVLTGRLAALMMLFAASAKGADEVAFERPESLQPAIAFWTRVYSEVDSLSGFIHDSSNLRIVYETLEFNWYDSGQVQDQQIEKAVQRYQSTLQVLASGKRTGLTAREKKVLALWGKQVSAATLQAAAERIRFQRGQKDRIRDGIVRAGAWENRIRRMLRDAGLPEQLAALPHVESSYNPYVESHAGAVGLWQFTLFTGRHYLRVDNVVDERVDPVKATDGAVRLLKKYYSRLNSWPLTITAYNHGLSGVRRAVQETGSTDIGVIVQNYTGPRFGFASRNYYAAFLAAADVLQQPKLVERAGRMIDWELSIQLPDGAFPGHFGEVGSRPVIFNTGQIMHGMIAGYSQLGRNECLEAAVRAGHWLLQQQDDDGCWRRYEHNNVPHVYNTRATWALLSTGLLAGESGLVAAACRNLDWALQHRQRIEPGTVGGQRHQRHDPAVKGRQHLPVGEALQLFSFS